MINYSVRKDDFVMIIAGKDKGKTAQVIGVDKAKHRVYVEGNNLSTDNIKAVKARQANEKGGLIKRPGSVDISNVMPICSACSKPTRVGYSIVDGKRVRICKSCGVVLVTKKASAKAATKTTVRKKTAVKKIDADKNVDEINQETTKTTVKKSVPKAEVKVETVKKEKSAVNHAEENK